MARCAICEHPSRAAVEAELDAAFASADGLSALADKYALKLGALRRHRSHITADSAATTAPPPAAPPVKPTVTAPPLVVGTPAYVAAVSAPVTAAAGEEEPPPESGERELQLRPGVARDLARQQITRLQALHRQAVESDQPLPLRLDIEKTMARAITGLARLNGELGPADVTRILASPDWAEIRGEMVATLKPWPDALEALGKALQQLEQRQAAQAATAQEPAKAA